MVNWCLIVKSAAISELPPLTPSNLPLTISDVMVAISNCDESNAASYETTLLLADSFIVLVESSPEYTYQLDLKCEIAAMDGDMDREMGSYSDEPSLGLAVLAAARNVPVIGDAVGLLIDRLTYITPDDPYSIMFGISSIKRYLDEQVIDEFTRQKLSDLVMTAAAIIYSHYFTESMLSSPTYLTHNMFEMRRGKQDIVAALIAIKELYPRVHSDSRKSLLNIAGGLKLGFSSPEGTRSANLSSHVEKVKSLNGRMVAPLLLRLHAIMAQADRFSKEERLEVESPVDVTQLELEQVSVSIPDESISISDGGDSPPGELFYIRNMMA